MRPFRTLLAFCCALAILAPASALAAWSAASPTMLVSGLETTSYTEDFTTIARGTVLDTRTCVALTSSVDPSIGDASNDAKLYLETCSSATPLNSECSRIGNLGPDAWLSTPFASGRGFTRWVSTVAPTGGDTARVTIECQRAVTVEPGTGAVSSVFARSGAVTAQSGDYLANQVSSAPVGTVAASNVQAAIQELDTEKLAVAASTPFTTAAGSPSAVPCVTRPCLYQDTTAGTLYVAITESPTAAIWLPVGVGGTGADASCASGTVRGGGYDPATNTYSWTCGNYPWSAESGGRNGNGTPAYNTATTAGGNAFVINCTGHGTGTFQTFPVQTLNGTDLASVCLAAGERVVVNAMADIMLAQDHTRSGGIIYLPTGIYVHKGCGAKPNGSGFTANACPVLRPPMDGRLTRHVSIYAGNKLMGAGLDPDGPLVNGRTGTWLVDDLGGNSLAPTPGTDAADGAAWTGWTFKSGLELNGTPCVPLSNTDPTCVPASTNTVSNASPSDGLWGLNLNTGLLLHTAAQSDPGTLCVPNPTGASSNRTCRGDRRITCSTTTHTTGIPRSSGGCLFGATELGPCDNFFEGLEADLAIPDRNPIHVMIVAKTQALGGAASNPIPSDDPFMATVVSAPGSACGSGSAGKTVAIGAPGGTGWTLTQSQIQPSAGAYLYVLDWRNWWNEGGGYYDLSVMPNNWYGRDVPGTSAGDCLSGGNPNQTADEPACDVQEIISTHSAWGGGLHRIAAWFGSGAGVGSNYDGSPHGLNARIEDSLFAGGKRSAITDSSGWLYKNVVYLDNDVRPAGTCFNAAFTSHSIWEDVWIVNNNCNATVMTFLGGKGSQFRRLHFLGNAASQAGLRMESAIGVQFENLEFVGGRSGGAQSIVIAPITGSSVDALTFRTVRIYGSSPLGGNNWGKAAVAFTTFGDAWLGGLSNVLIDDLKVESSSNNECLVMMEDSDDSHLIVTNRPSVTITDSSITSWNGATGTKGVCVADPPNASATGDKGWWPERYRPRITNVRVNGVPQLELPWTQTVVANAGTCIAAPSTPAHVGPGAVSAVTDDSNTVPCAQSAGALTGGGTTARVCRCVLEETVEACTNADVPWDCCTGPGAGSCTPTARWRPL